MHAHRLAKSISYPTFLKFLIAACKGHYSLFTANSMRVSSVYKLLPSAPISLRFEGSPAVQKNIEQAKIFVKHFFYVHFFIMIFSLCYLELRYKD